MGDRFYHHCCPQDVWDNGIEYLPPEQKQIALEVISSPDLELMRGDPVRDDWVYFVTRKWSEKLERIVHIYLERLSFKDYGSW